MQSTIRTCEFDYVVMGAGPSGLAAAGHIAKTGARVAVFEGRPRPENVFGSYPVVLNARGLNSLEALDPNIVKRVSEVGLKVSELHVVPANRTVAQVRTYGTGIMRDQAAQVLLEAAEHRSNIQFFWEHRLESVDVANHSCTFTTPQGAQMTLSNIPRLVASDGNRSRVRQACAQQVPDFVGEELPWGFQLRFMTSKPGLENTKADPETHYVLGDKGYVCQQPNGVWNISLRVLPGFDEDFLTADEPTPERVQKLKEYVAENAGIALDLIDDDSYQDFYKGRAFDGLVIKSSCLNPAGWIAIIGDAAHAVQPATGEGINSGLEDAATLGRAVQEHPEDPFAAFDAEHRANAHALQKLALKARDLVVPASTRDRAVGVMVTIGLGIAKKLHIIEGTKQDFMLGELASTQGVKSYAELEEMEQRQTRGLRKTATGIARVLRLSKDSPMDVKQREAAMAVPDQAAGA
jgi:2-polyprenyl-6-methoxyphenol hydroxylase-like FAD-dependent oxidoreductase